MHNKTCKMRLSGAFRGGLDLFLDFCFWQITKPTWRQKQTLSFEVVAGIDWEMNGHNL